MQPSRSLTRALLGVWISTLFTFVPASSTDETRHTGEPKERPAWAQSSHAPSKAEEAIWFLHDEIEKEAVEVIGS